MAPNTNTALDTLARMVQIVGRDPDLLRWFRELARKPADQRRNDIYLAAERMRAEGKDQELVTCFRLLADPRVFEAARVALRECGYLPSNER
jgi:hypothetical protein